MISNNHLQCSVDIQTCMGQNKFFLYYSEFLNIKIN